MESRWMDGNWFRRTGKTETKLPARRGATASCRTLGRSRDWGPKASEVQGRGAGWNRGWDINLCKKPLEPRSAPQSGKRWKPAFCRRLKMKIGMKCYTKDGISENLHFGWWDSPHRAPLSTLQAPLLSSVSAVLQLHMAADWKFLKNWSKEKMCIY